MNPFVSRIVVGLAGIPVVLGFVWLGSWWLFGLAAVACMIALHEFYSVTRELRPLLPAGYIGALLALLGAELGGIDWLTGGFLATLALAFLLKGIAETRQSTTVAVGATVLGVAWIGLGLGHLILVRDLPAHGRLVAVAVILCVWGNDTLAYFAGRFLGRHKLAPVVSPGKTWEGFIAGTAAAIFIAFVAFYKQDYLTIWQSLVFGAVIAAAAPIGDLFESAMKRDMKIKDTGRLLGAHGGVLDRIDALLFASIAAYYTILAF